jgi:hypothetical protein
MIGGRSGVEVDRMRVCIGRLHKQSACEKRVREACEECM